jgi:hypothetical protein
MKTITTSTDVYTYSELSDTAKERARDWYVQGFGYFDHNDEALDSLKAFCNFAGIKLRDYSLDTEFHRSYASIEGLTVNTVYASDTDDIGHDETLHEHIRSTFDEKTLSGHCPFTGVCWDETLLDGIRDAFLSPDQPGTIENLKELYQDCFHRLFVALQREYEYQTGEEAVQESIEANEYTFTADGRRFG